MSEIKVELKEEEQSWAVPAEERTTFVINVLKIFHDRKALQRGGDHVFRLESDDGSYVMELPVTKAVDYDRNYLELIYMGVVDSGTYSLYQVFADGTQSTVFEEKPYSELSQQREPVVPEEHEAVLVPSWEEEQEDAEKTSEDVPTDQRTTRQTTNRLAMSGSIRIGEPEGCDEHRIV